MKKIAIVGTAESWKFAPFNDESFEIWVLNDMYDIAPKFDRLFEMHELEHLKQYYSRYKNKPHLEQLATLQCPVYMQKKIESISNSVEYPLQTILDKFGGYFTNTVSYMIALAILEGCDELHLYGVNMAVGDEYTNQRPSCEYFVGLAKGMGVKVYIPEESDLLKTYALYGYEDLAVDEFTTKCKDRLKFLEGQLNNTLQQIDAHKKLYHQYEGAIADLKHVMMMWNT